MLQPLEEWKCPCGTCNTDDGYADWSNECLKEYEKEKSNEIHLLY